METISHIQRYKIWQNITITSLLIKGFHGNYVHMYRKMQKKNQANISKKSRFFIQQEYKGM